MSQHFQDIQKAFAAHIRNPEKNPMVSGVEARRALIYSDLFYNNVESFIARAFPVLKKIIGKEKWHAMIREFMETHACKSPYFLDIAKEFLEYLREERKLEKDPPFILELAHYEWIELALEISQEEIPTTGFNATGNLLKSQILISPLAWLLHYHWPVHKISPTFQPNKSEQDFFLIIYRNKDDHIRFMEVNAVSARLLSIIQENEKLTGTEAIELLAEELNQHQHFPVEQLRHHGQEILNQLRDQGIILGSRISPI